MAIYLKKFETMSQYNAYTADTENFILPNVSLTVDNNTVHYNPSTPPTPSHDFVEIGGVKWATMNVGANSITDTGLYFQWGDTQGYTASQVGSGEGQKYFGWEDYKWTEDGGSTMSKYTCSGSSGSGSGSGSGSEGDGLCELQPSDDAVTAAWGGSWRMPTTDEYAALGAAVNSAWTADYQGSGVAGLVCTDKTDSSKVLFFPACGHCINDGVYNVGSHGYYWSSSLYSGNVQFACNLDFNNGFVNWSNNFDRSYGFLVRGVVG